MRPMKLTMQAFGAYREKMTIDFGELGDRSFFLIHGPTGSGKTTILDAICFALYGEASGQFRTSKTVRSDFADDKTRTFVELVFAVGTKIYRVERSPEQERAKMRGEGTMIEKPQATLWHIKEDEDVVLASSTRTVTEQIQEMLGFECSQFRQVVLLPQGEFRKLLSANSADRQEIMKTLFRTGLYEKIEEHLKQKAGGVKKLFEMVEQERRIVLETSGVRDERELEDAIAGLMQEERKLCEKTSWQKKLLAEKDAALAEGKRIDALFTEASAAEETYRLALQKKEAADALRGEWQTAMRADKLASSDAYLTQEEAVAVQKRQLLAQSESTLEGTQSLMQTATQSYLSEKAREKERQQAQEACSQLERLTEIVRALKQAEKEQLLAQQEEKRAEEDWNDKKKQCQKYEKALEELNKRREEKLDLAKELAIVSATKEQSMRLYQTSLEKDTVSREIIAAEKTLTAMRERADLTEKQAQAAEERYHDVELRWQKAQAGVWASSLADGSPCPVCGSIHHPNLAEAGEAPSDEERKTAKQNAKTNRESHTKISLKLATLCAHQESRLKKREELLQILGQDAPTTQKLGEEVTVLTQKEQQAKDAIDEAEGLKKRIASGEKILADTMRARDEAQSRYQKAVATTRALMAVVSERQGQVPPELTAQGALEQAKRKADAQVKTLTNAWQKAETSYQTAQAELVKATAAVASLRSSVTEQDKKCQMIAKRLLEEAKELGFDDRQAIRAAMRPSQWRKDTEAMLQKIDDTALAAKDRHWRALKAIEGQIRLDLTSLSQEKQAAQEAYLSVVKAHQTKQDAIRRAQANQKKIADCTERIGELEASYRVIGQLAGIAGGNNEKKLTFQRYVLSELLTEVAEVASIRLLKMSRHRYTLQRTDELTRKNAAGGLEMEVFDNLTGVARPVGTLSGGEGFLASLALALGLADVVQSYAGGIRLDTMLIDEGFGTLDPEMLDFAISTLLELQRGGRLVGIISHVPELTERIDARLEVVQTNRGSTAVFHVG